MPQLHAQHRRLQSVETAVATLFDVLVFDPLSVVAQQHDPIRKVGAAGRHRSTVAIRPEVFAGIKTERGDVADRTTAQAFVERAVRLARILDDHQIVGARDGENRIHVGRLTVQVYGQDRLGAGCDGAFDLRDVNKSEHRITIDQHRRGSGFGNRQH